MLWIVIKNKLYVFGIVFLLTGCLAKQHLPQVNRYDFRQLPATLCSPSYYIVVRYF